MEEGKFYKQHGFCPFVTFWGGTLFAFYMSSSLVWMLANLFLEFGFKPISLYVILFLGFFTFSSFGLGLASAFPDIRLNEKGIEYQYLWIFSGLILWEEIEWIYSSKNQEIFGLLIQRKGYSRLTPKGLYFNQFYGRYVGAFGKPCLLLCKDIENFEQVLRDIKSLVKPSLVSSRSK